MRSLLAAMGIAVAAATTGLPAAAMEPWEVVLRDQLRQQLGCKALAVTRVRMFELAGEPTIDGHADCEDGRAYDFTRPKEHMPFEFRQCMPAVC